MKFLIVLAIYLIADVQGQCNYVVPSGDTFWNMAGGNANYACYLMQINRYTDPCQLKAGSCINKAPIPSDVGQYTCNLQPYGCPGGVYTPTYAYSAPATTTYVQSAPATTYVQSAPATTYVQSAPATTYYSAPAPAPAPTYVQSAPATTYYSAPAPAPTYTYSAPATTYVQPTTTYVQSAPATTYVQSAPATTYVQSAPAYTYSTGTTYTTGATGCTYAASYYSTGCTSYTIKSGDTLFNLARGDNCCLSAIYNSNPGISAATYTLQIGSTMCLPSCGSPGYGKK